MRQLAAIIVIILISAVVEADKKIELDFDGKFYLVKY
jgi:hypothetical protein